MKVRRADLSQHKRTKVFWFFSSEKNSLSSRSAVGFLERKKQGTFDCSLPGDPAPHGDIDSEARRRFVAKWNEGAFAIHLDKAVVPCGVASHAHLVPTIFHEPWWLRIASEGRNHEATVSMGGTVVGRLPYCRLRRVRGLTVLGMPALSHVLGPALSRSVTEINFPRSLKQISITSELIAQLPAASHISFWLHAGVGNALAFDVAGFRTGVGYTVEIRPQADDVMWRQMRDKTRNVIRRAEERLTVAELSDHRPFLDFYSDNLKARGLSNIYDMEICRALVAECLHRGVGRLLTAADRHGDLHAAIFTVWDHEVAYYLMSTRRRDAMNGATSLVIWRSIQHAAQRGLRYDMDGVHVRRNRLPNLLLLTGFGGTLQPRYHVSKSSALVDVAQSVRRVIAKRSFGPVEY